LTGNHAAGIFENECQCQIENGREDDTLADFLQIIDKQGGKHYLDKYINMS
jgi:hypothetical protein